MGRKIYTNHKDEWEMFSTVSDTTVYSSRCKNDFVKQIIKDMIYKTKLQCIQEIMAFPNQWIVNDEFIKTKDIMKFYEWQKEYLFKTDTDDEYYKIIDEKLDELIEELERDDNKSE
jgi:hypothetical protein